MVSECFVPWSANRLLSWSLQYVQFREPVVTDFSFLGEPSTSRRQSLSFMQLRNEGDKDQRPTPALPCPASLLDGMLTKMLDFYLHECSCKQSCQITAAWSCNVTFKRPNQSTTLTHLGAYIYIYVYYQLHLSTLARATVCPRRISCRYCLQWWTRSIGPLGNCARTPLYN